MAKEHDDNAEKRDTPIVSGIKKVSMVWPIAVGFCSIIFIMGRMTMQQDILIRDFRTLSMAVQSHLESDGHRVAISRTDTLIRDVANLQRQVDDLRTKIKP